MRHQVQLEKYCPVSKNPLPGSTLTISYFSRGKVLDVIPLIIHVGKYVGGLRDEQGQLVIRDMETLIQRISDDCCEALGVMVKARADLILWPGDQKMFVHCWSRPAEQK
jgi:hypothetical protein